MPWFKVDDSFHSHPKVMALEPADVGIWVLAGTWSAHYLTDGKVALAILPRLGGTRANADALIKAGLWTEPEPDVFQFKDWMDYQPTKAKVESERSETRAKRREAGKRGAAARWGNAAGSDEKPDSKPDGKAMANAWQDDGKTMAPYPYPSSSNEEETSPLRDDVEALCNRLRDGIVANGSKPPTITKAWRTDARLLLDRDNRDLTKALNLIDWSQSNTFWRANIRSMSKFRAQYDTLRLQATEEWQKGKHPINPDQPEDIDPDQILGRDYWQVPPPPAGLTINEEIQWKRDQREAHREQRVKEARKKINV